MSEVVAIIGASDKPQRYANIAMHDLQKHGHQVVLVNPFKQRVEGVNCLDSIKEYSGRIDTVTLYVNPKRFHDHVDEVIHSSPRRVIMNPGTEDDEHEKTLVDAGIKVVRACTLVMLSQGTF